MMRMGNIVKIEELKDQLPMTPVGRIRLAIVLLHIGACLYVAVIAVSVRVLVGV